MQTSTKIIYTFNKFYGMFLRDIKNADEDMKKKVKENYKVIMKQSPKYLEYFWSNFSKYDGKIDSDNHDLLSLDVFQDITLENILSKVGDKNNIMIWNYVYVLSILSMMFYSTPLINHDEDKPNKDIDAEDVDVDSNNDDDIDNENTNNVNDDSEHDILFNKVISVISAALRGDDVNTDISDIIDDDIKEILLKIKKSNIDNNTEETSKPTDDIFNMFSSMQNSKICNLAKEISSEIDTSSLQLESPEDIVKLMDFSGSNNVLSNIIGKVSNKIQNKISSGEIKHDELLGEAMNMMSMMSNGGIGNNLFNNPMFAEMMKGMKGMNGMKGGKVVPRTDVIKKESMKERLRRKLEEKKENK